jgi:hypothetical protein
MRITFGGNWIDLELDGKGSGRLTSNLKDVDDEEEEDNVEYDRCIDGLESLVLAQACAGIDVTTPQYAEALVTAVDAICNATT